MNTSPKYRRPLNPNQLNALLFLFKFRFITSHLLSLAFGNKSRRTTHQSLQILEEQGYIAKRYDSSYKLQGRQATYYLLPKAIRELKTRYSFDESVLRVYLRNSSLSDSFIDHHLDIVRAYINLRANYPEQFYIFTKCELANFDYFPNPKSDIYIRRIKSIPNKSNEYLLDIYTSTPLFVIRRKADSLIGHFETTDRGSDSFPTILLACPDSKAETKVQSFALKQLDSSELTGLSIYTTTAKALLSNESSKNIWSDIENPQRLLTL